MLQIVLGVVTNSNNFNFEISLHRHVLPFSAIKEDLKFGKILNIREESE